MVFKIKETVIEEVKDLELQLDSEDEENSAEVEDADGSVKNTFTKGCKLVSETKALLNDNKYILQINGSREATPTIAVGSSESDIHLFHLNKGSLNKYDTLKIDEGVCVGITFAKDDPRMIYTAHSNGFVRLWDLRDTQRAVLTFEETVENKTQPLRPFTCMDVCPNNRLLVAGTEFYKENAYILFWDVRNSHLLGGYWESHTDVITQVKFHTTDKDKLISASTDGLINIYDLSQESEDDALIDCLNVECSIEDIKWFKKGNVDCLYCTTHIHDVQLWTIDSAEAYANFKRRNLGIAIRKDKIQASYIAGAHTYNDGQDLFILIGYNARNGRDLRSLQVIDNDVKPLHNFDGNTQRVRSSWYDEKSNILITGGEMGILNTWQLDLDDEYVVPVKKYSP